ncbi:MAG: recombinase RecT [Nannocystaceae bacterium]
MTDASRALALPVGPAAQSIIEAKAPEFEKSLAGRVDLPLFVRAAATVFARSEKLQRCTRLSVIGALMDCAELGLVPGSATGHAYLVPYGRECTLIPGYKGLVELAHRSGIVSSLYAETVREGEIFEVHAGTDPRIIHGPHIDSVEPVRLYYAVAKFKDGGHQFECISRAEVEKIRAGSKSKGSPAWSEWFDEMGKKTAIRRLCKVLPLSTDLHRAIEIDDRQYEKPDLSVERAIKDAQPTETDVLDTLPKGESDE